MGSPYSHSDEDFELSRSKRRASKGKSSEIKESIDLHGMTVIEAQSAVSQKIYSMRERYTGIVNLVIVTGKGLHSGRGGGVLSREIHDYVSNKFINEIISIDDSPCDVQLYGVQMWSL